MKNNFLLAALAIFIVSNVFAKTPNCNESAAPGVDWSGCIKIEAKLNKADLRVATLVETNFTKAELIEADLRGAILYKADLRMADFSHAKFRGAILKEAKLMRKAFKADFSWATLDEAELNYIDLEQANLSHASLLKAKTFRAKLADANFTHANLTDADFFQALVNNTNFKHATLINTDFYRMFLDGSSDFSHANLTNAKFTAAWFNAEANFTDADLTNTKFIGAKLDKVNFTRSRLDRADFSGALMNWAICKPGSIGRCIPWVVSSSRACVGMDRNLTCVTTFGLSPDKPKDTNALSIIEKGEYICEVELTGEYKPETNFNVEQNDRLNIQPLQWQLNEGRPYQRIEIDSRNASIGAALMVTFQSRSNRPHSLKFNCASKKPGLDKFRAVRSIPSTK
jgi:uncharacterized protein YjbI with pentapeptide repeats